MPPTSLTFTCSTDPAEAKAWFGALVRREPVALSVLAGVADSLIADPARYEHPRWWAGRDGSGDVMAAFMHTPPHPLHIAYATADDARALARLLAGQGDALPGVGGLRAAAEAFRDEWVARTGTTATTVVEIGAFDLPTRPRLPFAVPGRYRRATEADLPLADQWAQDFADAVEHTPRKAGTLALHVADGRVGLWEDGGGPVSMAYASPANGGVTRISGVWTPADRRGRGYATGVVAALSNERMEAGETCMLYTDLANPTSNGIYRALGYRRVGDSITIRFE